MRVIVQGLEEPAWYTPVVPSDWTVTGVIEHLGDAERHWFQHVVAGLDVDLPWDEGRRRPPSSATARWLTSLPTTETIVGARMRF